MDNQTRIQRYQKALRRLSQKYAEICFYEAEEYGRECAVPKHMKCEECGTGAQSLGTELCSRCLREEWDPSFPTKRLPAPQLPG